jgi:hypothetical protein
LGNENSLQNFDSNGINSAENSQLLSKKIDSNCEFWKNKSVSKTIPLNVDPINYLNNLAILNQKSVSYNEFPPEVIKEANKARSQVHYKFTGELNDSNGNLIVRIGGKTEAKSKPNKSALEAFWQNVSNTFQHLIK